MKPTALALFLILECGIPAAWAAAPQSGSPVANEPVTAQVPAQGQTEAAAATTPMMREILSLLETEQSDLSLLYERFAGANSEAEALALQKQIEARKRSTEIGVMQVQLRHARQDDRHEAVAKLEQALLEMEAKPEAAQ